jgi:hypothetical protein
MVGYKRRLIVAAGLVFSSVACDWSHSCTDIGCASGLTVNVRPASGTWADGDYELSAGAEQCTFSIPRDVPSVGSGTLDCYRRTSGGVGPSGLQLTFEGTPETLAVVLTRDGTAILDETSTPSYAESQPNGPDCGPHCRQGSLDLVVTP